jgi:hypothetical protein
LSGDIYVSEVVKIDKSPTRLDYIKFGDNPVVVTDTVFLRVLVRGKANLLYLKDENGKEHFYLQNKDLVPQELILRHYVQKVNGRNVLTSSSIYKGQLQLFFSDCPSVKNKTNHIDYKVSDLKDIVQQYNFCMGANEKDFVAEKQFTKVKVGMLAGVTQAKLRFSGEENNKELAQSDFESPMSHSLGFSLNIILPRSRQKWSVQNELAYKPYEAQGYFEEVKSTDYYSKSALQFKLGYVGLSHLLRYQMPLKKLKPFVNAGIANNFAFSTINQKVTTSRFYSADRVEKKEALTSLRKYEQALLMGAGCATGKITGEIRFETGNGIVSFNGLKSSKNMLSFLIGYSFN